VFAGPGVSSSHPALHVALLAVGRSLVICEPVKGWQHWPIGSVGILFCLFLWPSSHLDPVQIRSLML
jgi:hypothetical protein